MSGEVIEIYLSKLKVLKAGLDAIADDKFPKAVRNTLNNMAFHMKGARGKEGRIQARARSGFENERNKTFIKSLTWAEKATGNDVSKMSSGAGIYDKAGAERAARGLAKQETATNIKHGYSPLSPSRISGANARKVSSGNKHGKLGNYVDLTKFRQEKVMRGLILAQKVGRPVKIKGRKGRNYVAKTMGNAPKRYKNGNSRVRLKFLYIQNQGGIARLKKKVPFVQLAGRDAFEKFDDFFLDEFDYIFNKK